MTNIGELLERAAEEIEIRVTKTRVWVPQQICDCYVKVFPDHSLCHVSQYPSSFVKNLIKK